MSTGLPGYSAVQPPAPVAAHLVGYRTWRLTTEGAAPRPLHTPALISGFGRAGVVIGGLHGTFRTQYRWGDGTNTAQCLSAVRSTSGTLIEHEAWLRAQRLHEATPLPRQCGCGLWAMSKSCNDFRAGDGIVGVVHGWGRIVAGPRGFRAQHARIVALAAIEYLGAGDAERLRDAVQTCYPSPHWFGDAAAMMHTHPATDLAPLLGDDEP